ncbi:MAG: universal stress protein [Alphaproteobacteria bacterium]|nr:universal stress protein [Alphaproteobacteria bacterium]
MAIRNILAPATGAEATVASALDAAFIIAKANDGHVEVLSTVPDPKDSIAYLGEGMTGAMVEQVVAAVERDNKDRAAKADAAFKAAVARHGAKIADKAGQASGLTACLKSVMGPEDKIVPERGRLFDMIVLGRPASKDEMQPRIVAEAALLGSGRPVLLIPPGWNAKIGDTVAIAWNGSLESARAARLGGPFVRGAKKVVVLTIAEKGRAARAEELADGLAWHGVKAIPSTVAGSGKASGAAILARAKAEGADLLVMGAYTHSRFRELVFGGATSDTLDAAPIPVLMVH